MKAPFLVALLSLTLGSLRLLGQANRTDPYEGLARFKFGDSRLSLALIEEQIRKSSPAEYKPIEAKLLAVLRATDTPKDAKRYICRWLTVVGSPDCVPALAPLLTDSDLASPARLALEPMLAPAAGAALRDALPKVHGRLLAGLIGSLGIRRDPEAVNALVQATKDADSDVANAAIMALGAIGTESAAQALTSLQVPASLYHARGCALITAAARLKADGADAQAITLYRDLLQPNQLQSVRVAALKGLINSLPQAEAVKLVVATLQGDDAAMREATSAAYLTTTNLALQNAVAAELPAMKPPAQLILLGVLADLPGVSARPILLSLVEQQADPAIRVAAIDCLTQHGEPADVPLLLRLADANQDSPANAARQTLAKLGKPGVDEALIRAAESSSSPDRATALAVLANRRTTSALPLMVQLVGATDPALASAAAKALGVIGQGPQLAALADTIAASDNAQVRTACLEAGHAICTRLQDKTPAADAVLAALPKSQTPASRATLLALLGYAVGPDALAAVVKAMNDTESEVRQAAFRTLVGWPDATAVPYLVDVARRSPESNEAVVAMRDGCLRLAATEEVPLSNRLAAYRSVLETARRPEEKRLAVSGLAEIPSLGSLDLLKACAQDPALKNQAIPAGIRVAREVGIVSHNRAVAALQEFKGATGDEALRQQADGAIKALLNAGQAADGTILAWMVSGPYKLEGKTGVELFDVLFEPEKTGSKADWRPVGQAAITKTGLVELHTFMPGDERVAYLKTQLTSDRDQEALLEIGSDDGIKAWLNGKVILANNVIRSFTPGVDKIKVKLNSGVNRLVFKIIQGGGEWSACCRLRASDGTPLNGVTVGLVEE